MCVCGPDNCWVPPSTSCWTDTLCLVRGQGTWARHHPPLPMSLPSQPTAYRHLPRVSQPLHKDALGTWIRNGQEAHPHWDVHWTRLVLGTRYKDGHRHAPPWGASGCKYLILTLPTSRLSLGIDGHGCGKGRGAQGTRNQGSGSWEPILKLCGDHGRWSNMWIMEAPIPKCMLYCLIGLPLQNTRWKIKLFRFSKATTEH